MQRGELLLDLGEFGAGIGWDGRGDGLAFGMEASVAEGRAHPGRGAVVVFGG